MKTIINTAAAFTFAFIVMLSLPAMAGAASSNDAAITTQVRETLGYLGKNIKVKTVDGRVFTQGNMSYAEDANRAEWAARRVPGVQSVNANIGYAINSGGQ